MTWLDRLFEWCVMTFLVRACAAMGVGLALEIITKFLFTTMLASTEWFFDFLYYMPFWGEVVIFLFFHIVGWLIVLLDWGDIMEGGNGFPSHRIIIEDNDHLIVADIVRK